MQRDIVVFDELWEAMSTFCTLLSRSVIAAHANEKEEINMAKYDGSGEFHPQLW